MAALCLNFSSSAQNTSIKIQPLTIGDKVPEELWSLPLQVINQSGKKTISLREYKNKLIILDFMSTACSSCISYLPAIDKLTNNNKQNVETLIILSDKSKKMHEIKANRTMSSTSLSIVIEDSTLVKYFPHRLVSHIVWLHNDKVKAITTPQYINAINIVKIRSLESVNWKIKRDFVPLDNEASLFEVSANKKPLLNKSNKIFYCGVTPYLKGAVPGYSKEVDSINGLVKIKAYNLGIAQLYLSLLADIDAYPKSMVSISNDTSNRLYYNYTGNAGYRDVWNEQNTYCYEANLPINFSDTQINDKINSDLDFYFRAKGRFLTQEVSCYELVSDKVVQNIRKRTASVNEGDAKFCFNSIKSLLGKLNSSPIRKPFFSRIELEKGCKILLNEEDLNDIGSLDKALIAQNIRLTRVFMDMKMFVLESKDATNF